MKEDDMKWVLISAMVMFAFSTVTHARDQQKIQSTMDDRKSVDVTVYNNDRALIREVRTVQLPGGPVHLLYEDVASRIMPETVSIKRLSGVGFSVLEQNYEYDLLSPQKLLEKFLHRDVILVRHVLENNTTVEKRVRARLLSIEKGTVWKIGDLIVSNPRYDFLEFDELPDNLYARPTLVWLLDAEGGRTEVETSYLTTGMSWKADYVLTLSVDDSEGDLTGWVTITNQSGATYTNARLKLIAGEVHTVQPERRRRFYTLEARKAPAQPQFEEKAFFEYHLYTLSRRTTLHDRQIKQIELLHAEGLKLQKLYTIYGMNWYFTQQLTGVQKQKVKVSLRIANSKTNKLGIPLPEGIIRVYKKDEDGSSQFIGEDRIDHTPKDEVFDITMGEAFDIVAERKQLAYRILSSCLYESEFEIRIRNHKDEDITVHVIEPVGGDWEMLAHSYPYKKLSAFRIDFQVPVMKDGESVLTYRVRVRVC